MASFKRTASIAGSLAPSYTTEDSRAAAIELASLGSSSTRHLVDDDAHPLYARSPSAPFTPTVRLQIQTPGKSLMSLPIPPRPDPIPVYAVAASGAVASVPTYLSPPPARGSGSCTLVDAAHPAQAPFSTTTYRLAGGGGGPGRYPTVRLLPPLAPLDDTGRGEEQEEGRMEEGLGDWDVFQARPRGLLTRAQTFRTRLGVFEWRYAGRQERKAAEANSLLVLDRVVRVFSARNSGDAGEADEEERRPVAWLVRNGEVRSPGSSASSAGNGGRLLVDLSLWVGEGRETECKMVEVLVVTTVLCMLKKEVDRRRTQQIAMMSSGGGGP